MLTLKGHVCTSFEDFRTTIFTTIIHSLDINMLKNKLVRWAVMITAFIAWNSFGYSISSWIYSILTKIDVPASIALRILSILPLIILLEVFAKFLFLETAMPPLKFVATRAESWSFLNRDELNRYTSELEQLGFIQLTDYTSPSIQGMARLFAHPQKFCFAEVGQTSNSPMLCSISCSLEMRWSLAVTNISSSSYVSAISYAFLRQPRNLVKQMGNASVNLLLQSLIDGRDRASNDLGLELIRDIKTETYFEKERSKRMEQRRSMLRKSITWGVLEMLWFSLRPKSEWLGDYSKFTVKR
ncbi:hypothetical protein IQ235_11480 [Oscillatoriales cyanobacterium LEGE 11467]|uniref:Uncharacterized protein n=1 Tax=Zarconia navalis LEGE 11467 TaxID=1828826 RepID=A0A928VY30_9CYAN|nr:hypothetical protein [Zarconia navalis]MBE9041403.1 hypothetical protein [Zarconia navalis LEGE 11467]